MRMYTIHFGQGQEHTQGLLDQAKGNLPFNFAGWGTGTNPVPNANGINSQIVSHKEIFERYGVKGGHGEYCLETWGISDISLAASAASIHTGGHASDAQPFYLKFDFMYTDLNGGSVIILQRTKTDTSSRDLQLSISEGFLKVAGTLHITQPDTEPPTHLKEAWFPLSPGQGTAFLAPNKWHEIQIFVNQDVGWEASIVGPDVDFASFNQIDPFVPAFSAYELAAHEANPFSIKSSEDRPFPPNIIFEKPLKMDSWPANGHPQFPNVMLPGQNQTAWPPENFGSGQYFYGDNLGIVYVWVNGRLDIQYTTNMINDQDSFDTPFSQESTFFGFEVTNSSPSNPSSARFFYDNIIWNDLRDPSGSFPSQIFDPLFSSHPSLEWNPGYDLKFIAMEMEPSFWEFESSRKHDTWLPEFPTGGLVPSGEAFNVASPNRFGAPTDRMIPHGTKLTIIHTDWNGDVQDYTVSDGDRALYPDYNVDYAYQHVQPNESNPFASNQNDPKLTSVVSGHKTLFYLKRPPATSGKQPLAGGPGLGGVKDYVPQIFSDLGETTLPSIYRIWTCLQDNTNGTDEPIDTQHHLIRVPSGVSGYVDYVSDNQCPGDRTYRAYHNGIAAIGNGYSMADWPYNPITGDPWTWDDLEDLQIGVSHETHNGNGTAEIYTVYLVVEHASTVNPDISILGDNLLDWEIADDIPFLFQSKDMYRPGWRFNVAGGDHLYYNRWDVDPIFAINRTNTQSSDSQAIISGMQFSGIIEFDYSIRYINGEIVQGDNFRKMDEHYPEVWVYTISGYSPANPIRPPFRSEVITDANGDNFTFLTYPVLQYNDKRFITDPNLSPVSLWPYILYDYNTLYIVPLTTHRVAHLFDPEEVLRTWTDPKTKPATSGSLGVTWIINKQQNAFNFSIDADSYFHPFSPSSVSNHISTHPNEALDTTFPQSRSGHDYYFQAPNLSSGSVSQTLLLTDVLGIPAIGIDNGLYEAYIGLYQTTVNQAVNDTGEGIFKFYNGNPDSDTFISGYTLGLDGTAGWHLNATTVQIPSGTRQVRFTFSAVINTDGNKSPGGTLGGTSNFAAFDEPFFIPSLSSSYTDNAYHPADVDQDSRISSTELVDYIGLWQSGLLPLGIAKNYLTKAEEIWQSGVSTHFGDISGGLYRDSGGTEPEKWSGSGSV